MPKNTKINLCDTCVHCISTCPATPETISHGDGVGNDNIITCAHHEEDAVMRVGEEIIDGGSSPIYRKVPTNLD